MAGFSGLLEGGVTDFDMGFQPEWERTWKQIRRRLPELCYPAQKPVALACLVFVVPWALMTSSGSTKIFRQINSVLQRSFEAIGRARGASERLRRHRNLTCREIIIVGLAGLCCAVPGRPQSQTKVPGSSTSAKSNAPAATPGN